MLEAIRAHLLKDETLAALVGSRLYPLTVPEQETEYPLTVYQRISTIQTHSKLGPTGIWETRLQFASWSDRLAEAQDVARSVRTSIDGFHGIMEGVRIYSIRSDTENDIYEPAVGLYQVMTDFIILH